MYQHSASDAVLHVCSVVEILLQLPPISAAVRSTFALRSDQTSPSMFDMMLQQEPQAEGADRDRLDAHAVLQQPSLSSSLKASPSSLAPLNLPTIPSPATSRRHDGRANTSSKASPRVQRTRGISMPVPASIPSPRLRSPALPQQPMISPSSHASYQSYGALSHDELAHLKQIAAGACASPGSNMQAHAHQNRLVGPRCYCLIVILTVTHSPRSSMLALQYAQLLRSTHQLTRVGLRLQLQKAMTVRKINLKLLPRPRRSVDCRRLIMTRQNF